MSDDEWDQPAEKAPAFQVFQVERMMTHPISKQRVILPEGYQLDDDLLCPLC
jgi:hypothetical protein